VLNASKSEVLKLESANDTDSQPREHTFVRFEPPWITAVAPCG